MWLGRAMPANCTRQQLKYNFDLKCMRSGGSKALNRIYAMSVRSEPQNTLQMRMPSENVDFKRLFVAFRKWQRNVNKYVNELTANREWSTVS